MTAREIGLAEARRAYERIIQGDGAGPAVELPDDPHEAARRYAEVVGADGGVARAVIE